MKTTFEKYKPLKWRNAEPIFDYSTNAEYLEYYKNLYPAAEVVVDTEYENEWVEDGYYADDDPEHENYIDNGYYDTESYLNVYIEFKNEVDEAEFIMRESP